MKNKKHILIPISIIFFAIFIVLIFNTNTNEEKNSIQNPVIINNTESLPTVTKDETNLDLAKKETTETIIETEQISIKIITGESSVEVTSPKGLSFYEILVLSKNKKEIDFEGKEYSGLGFFVTKINNLTSGSGKNLIYYINNIEASVGVSDYKPNDGDIIEWKLK